MAKHTHHKSPPTQPTPEDQSGSTGRRTEDVGKGADKNTGQDQYGQSGSGGKRPATTDGQKRYQSGK